MMVLPEADGQNSFDRSTLIVSLSCKDVPFHRHFYVFHSLSSHFFPGTIASLAALAILILTTVFAGILIVAPVAGLRPMRAFLFTKTSFPIPGRTKEPAFLVSETARAATSSIIAEAAFLGSTNLLAKWDTVWDLVMGFFAIWRSPLWWIMKLDSGSILERGAGSKWEIQALNPTWEDPSFCREFHSDFHGGFLRSWNRNTARSLAPVLASVATFVVTLIFVATWATPYEETGKENADWPISCFKNFHNFLPK